jgi:putative salt-induced outer membrane protein
MIRKFLPALCLLPLLIQAADETDTSEGVWAGRGALGYTSTSGNTDSENLNASLQGSYEKLKWKHSLLFETIRSEADNEVSADSWTIIGRSEYSLSEKSYAFGQARYQEDEFSGFDYQGSAVAGVGSRFIDTDTQLLDLSVGAGYSQFKETETGDTVDGAIITSDLKYEYRISENATFSEVALVEAGADNTYFQSETALLTTISGNLSSKISYLIKHNTDVPDDVEETDEIISVSLVYDF